MFGLHQPGISTLKLASNRQTVWQSEILLNRLRDWFTRPFEMAGFIVLTIHAKIRPGWRSRSIPSASLAARNF